jgi:hypothetical protein
MPACVEKGKRVVLVSVSVFKRACVGIPEYSMSFRVHTCVRASVRMPVHERANLCRPQTGRRKRWSCAGRSCRQKRGQCWARCEQQLHAEAAALLTPGDTCTNYSLGSRTACGGKVERINEEIVARNNSMIARQNNSCNQQDLWSKRAGAE